jgi:hypothetical protein
MTFPQSDGWIGHWSPGIGDPTIVGGLTVIFYFFGAWQCYRIVATHSNLLRERERALWWTLALGLLALGINKQLDLQSALTEVGRIVAIQQGWYEKRHAVQGLFLLCIAALAGFTAIAGVYLARNAPFATMSAVVGGVLLLAFVVMRATSFNHFDAFIGSEYLGLRMNWIMEIGGIWIISISALWRLRTD